MYSEKVLQDLEEIVNKGLEEVNLPYQKGNSIRIKHIAIRKSPKGYLIYNTKENVQVTRTQFKSTAVAIAKNLAQGKDRTADIERIDFQLTKHYNDVIFFKNALRNTDDPFKREIRQTRLDISIHRSQRLRDEVDRYIFGM